MYLMYASYAVTVWLAFAAAFAIQLREVSNSIGLAFAYLFLLPLMAVGLSAEVLLFHVSREEKQAIVQRIADGSLSRRYVVVIGISTGVATIVLTSVSWKLSTFAPHSLVLFCGVLALISAWLIIGPTVGLGFVVARGNVSSSNQQH
jgi:hypothetical protein